jgi:hypothetical protein
MTKQPTLAVIRIPNVAVSQAELNLALKIDVDRYEASRHHPGKYAQIDIEDSQDLWRATLRCIQSIRNPVHELISAGLIGAPTLDVALSLPDSSLTKSWTIPAKVAAAAGEMGMDIQLSVYLTETVT